MRKLRLLIGFALVGLINGPSRAQQLGSFVRVVAENDQFNFWLVPRERPDEDYTQGLRFEWQSARVPRGIRTRFCGASACASTLETGQEMYTPVNDDFEPIRGERPYAGWLYGRGSVRMATNRLSRSLSGVIGVTGRASLAEQVQTKFHQLIPKFRQPKGWAYQLPTEVDFAVAGDQAWYMRGRPSSPHWTDLEPYVSGEVGTLRTALESGARLRVGWHLGHPWLVDSAARVEAHVFAAAGLAAVLHDLFLDGTTYKESVMVDRVPIVASWQRGIEVRLGRLTLEYRAVTSSHTYKTQPVSHTFGGIVLGWRTD